MNFYDIDHHFCEGNILGMPEILNSFTSIIFSIFGIYGLFNNKNDNISFIDNNNSFITNFIYSTFIVIGIGSFGFHWTEQIGWALMDEIPMIVSIFMGTLYIEYCNILLYKFDNKYNFIKDLNYKITTTFLTFIMFYFIVINQISYYRKLFPIFFGCILILFYYKIINLLLNFDKKFNKNILLYGKYQLLIIFIAALIWCFTEIICKFNKNIFLLIGHPLWHLLISYGFYNIIQIIYYVNIYIKIKSTLLSENFIEEQFNNKLVNINIDYNNFFILYIKSKNDYY